MSYFEIETNRDGSPGLTFQVLSVGHVNHARVAADRLAISDVASISATGQVTTFTTPGLATILVTHSDNGVNQSMAVLVEVAAIAHLSVVPVAMAWPPGARATVPFMLPIGVTTEFQIRLHDQTGRTFHTANGIVFAERLHRFDVVRIRPGPVNTTYPVTATNVGNAILCVSIANHPHAYTADYIRIRVTPAIEPGLGLSSKGGQQLLGRREGRRKK